jgi:hypothetical protein
MDLVRLDSRQLTLRETGKLTESKRSRYRREFAFFRVIDTQKDRSCVHTLQQLVWRRPSGDDARLYLELR